MATDGEGRSSSSPGKPSGNSNSATINKFSNDGSFLEMFKKKMEEQNKIKNVKKESENTSQSDTVAIENDVACDSAEATTSNDPSLKKPNIYAFVGKRRGGAPVLKTGAVKKQKKEDQPPAPTDTKDAWARYLQEVQKYKSQSCQDEDRTRPLVK